MQGGAGGRLPGQVDHSAVVRDCSFLLPATAVVHRQRVAVETAVVLVLVLARLLVSSPLACQLRLRVTRVLVQTVPDGGGVGGHADDGEAGGLWPGLCWVDWERGWGWGDPGTRLLLWLDTRLRSAVSPVRPSCGLSLPRILHSSVLTI